MTIFTRKLSLERLYLLYLLEGIDLLAIDEAQNIPDIDSKLKLIVDEIEGIRVIASGSSSFQFYRNPFF